MAKEFVDGVIKGHKVVVFSKTYCPYCKMAKDVLKQAGVQPFVAELDTRGNIKTPPPGCLRTPK